MTTDDRESLLNEGFFENYLKKETKSLQRKVDSFSKKFDEVI